MSASEIELEKGLLVLSPGATLVAGGILSLGAGLLSGAAIRWVFDDFFEFEPWLGTIGLWVGRVGGFGWTLSTGYCHDIEVGHVAVPTFLGKRRNWFVLTEGDQWLIPGMGKLQVNAQVQTSVEKTLPVVSRNGILMDGGYLLVYQIVNPIRHFDARDPIKTLEEIADGALRDSFAEQDEEELRASDVRSHIAEKMSRMLAARARQLGYKVDVVITKAQPPAAVLKANADKAVETAQRESEQIELDGLITKIRQMRDLDYSPEKAYEILAAERNKIKTQRQIFKLEGVEPIVDKLLPIAQKLIERIFTERK